MDGTILGIDLGTSSMKCVIYDSSLCCTAAIRRPYRSSPSGLRSEDWWDALLGALGELREKTELSRVGCVSFSGYNALVGVDRDGNGVTPVFVYNDPRPAEYISEITDEADFDFVFSRSGNRLSANGVMASAIRLWQDKGGGAAAVDCWLYSSGYLARRLTGVNGIDATRASLSLLCDPGSAGEPDWDEELLRFFSVRRENLPRIFAPEDAVGTITAEAARLTGLPQGIPVAAGAMDSMCAALGSGATQPGMLLDIGGSAGGMAAISDIPRPHKSFYLVRTAIPGRWCNIGPLDMSGSLFTWYVRKFLPGQSIDDYFEHMETVPPFSSPVVFLPYVGSARHPYWVSGTFGHFLNLGLQSGIDDLSRAVMDGLACAYRRVLDDFLALGLRPEAVICAGGDSRSGAWLRTKADVLRLPYRVSAVREASSRGSVLIGAKTVRQISSLCAPELTPACTDVVNFDELFCEKAEKYYMTFQKYCDILYS